MSNQPLKEPQEDFDCDKEAHLLLDLINTEFQTDPWLVKCFDRRIVERVKRCVEANKESIQNWLQLEQELIQSFGWKNK